MKNFKSSLLWLLVGLLLISGCSGKSYTRDQWDQATLPGSTEVTFEGFTGFDYTEFEAGEGDSLTMEIELTKTNGELSFILLSPNGELLWESGQMAESELLPFSLELTETGTYKIQYLGVKASGSFKITWETTSPEEDTGS